MIGASSAAIVKMGALLMRDAIGWGSNFAVRGDAASPFDPAGVPP
jgi:hypothetical protein